MYMYPLKSLLSMLITVFVLCLISFTELRAEANLLRQHVEAQAKELIQRKQKLEELEEKERVANDNVTCL